jgi:hypothetical protein
MPWSKAIRLASLLREPRPTLPPRMAKTLVSRPAAGPLFCDLFNVHLYLGSEVDLERVVEIGDSGFSRF